jgi:hypothetical protein
MCGDANGWFPSLKRYNFGGEGATNTPLNQQPGPRPVQEIRATCAVDASRRQMAKDFI